MVSDVSFYEDKVKDLDVLLGSKDIANRRLGALRLFFFIVSLFMFLAGYFLKKNTILMCSAILPLAVFLVLVVVHGKLKKEIAFLEKKREVTSLYIARINGDFERLKDGGSEFEPQRHDYSLDLDVLGDHSLFALYNISETFYGREEFADLLKKLNQAIRDHRLNKHYRTIVSGILEDDMHLVAFLDSESNDKKVLISDKPMKGYKEIITDVSVIKSGAGLTYAEIGLITGRKHQIRAHLSHIGHPILGDLKYGSRVSLKRLMLHSYRLSLPEDILDGLEIVAPIPQDMREVINDI